MTPAMPGRPRRPHPATILLIAVLACRTGTAEEVPTATPQPIPRTPSAAESVQRTEEIADRLNHLAQSLDNDGELVAAEAQVADLHATVEHTFSETLRYLAQNPFLSAITDLNLAWQQIGAELKEAQKVVAEINRESTRLAERVAELRNDWEAVRDGLLQSPLSGTAQIGDKIGESIAAREGAVRVRQARGLALQERIIRDRRRLGEADEKLLHWEQARASHLLRADTVPVWRQPELRDAGLALAELRAALAAFLAPFPYYLSRHRVELVVEFLLVLVLAASLRAARHAMRRWAERTAETEEFFVIAERPLSAAVGVAAILGLPVHSDAPRAIWVLLAGAGLLSLLRIARRIVDPKFAFLLNSLAACALAGLVRSIPSTSAPWLQVAVGVQSLLISGLTLWIVRRRADRLPPKIAASLAFFGPAVVAVFAAAAGSAAAGYLDLPHLVIQSLLPGAVVGACLIVIVRILGGLFAFLLRIRPFSNFRLVRRNRPYLQDLAARGLSAAALAVLAYVVLQNLGLMGPVRSLAGAALAIGFSRGNVTLTVGNVVAFAATLYLSWLLSRVLRFVLDEDVYPRVTLPRGVSYALSTLLHYSVLTLGFVLALGVVGFDLTKATILVSALGIGVGFGLQNIVNNFVSGLILLFERPVQVGDSVTIGAVEGTVKHIGIRSSSVRTWDGAEVIVPNAALIADPVTNWTLSDRLRRLRLSVGVAYGTDPAVVVGLLRGAAVGHEAVAEHPEPQALFMGFGDSALNFELRAWTDRADGWMVVQSDLYLAVHAALTEAGIAIPFPQRDVHVDADKPLTVQLVRSAPPESE